MVETARAAGIQLIEVRRCIKGIGFLKKCARRFVFDQSCADFPGQVGCIKKFKIC